MLSANPCMETQRDTLMPIAAILSSPTHTPVSPGIRPADDPEVGQRPDQRFFQVAQVAVQVLPVFAQIQDGVADQLPRRMVGDLAAPVHLHDGDALRPQPLRRRQQVFPLRPPPQRDRRRVFQQQQRVGDLPRLPPPHQLVLPCQRLRVRHQARDRK